MKRVFFVVALDDGEDVFISTEIVEAETVADARVCLEESYAGSGIKLLSYRIGKLSQVKEAIMEIQK